MADSEAVSDLNAQIEALEDSAGGAHVVFASFDRELQSMRSTVVDAGRDVRVLSAGISGGLRRAFDDLIFDGATLSQTLGELARSLADAAYNAAMRPVTQHVGGIVAQGIAGLIGGQPFANGAGFSQGRVIPFASGGVVSGPVSFPMRGGVGLMGEAGPEAIMPLSRGADGKLGVRAEGSGRGATVVMNVSTPDVEGFRRSQSQIAAQLGRALSRGQRNR